VKTILPSRQREITAEYVREILNYDPLTGIFTNKAVRSPGIKVGAVATSKRKDGYLLLCLKGIQYFAHRIAWLHFYGEWPNSVIDHRNGRNGENWIDNLRDVPVSVNIQNRKGAQKNSKLGILGVSPSKKKGKYRARITLNRKSYLLGDDFDTPQEAQAAYLKAKKEMHKGASLV
jgi:hypothetical protein